MAAAPLKPMPLIVLSADERYDIMPFVENGTMPLTADQAKKFARLLFSAVVDARADLVSQVPGARHIKNTDSGHYIHQEHPKLVIDAIREVVDAAAVGSTTLGDTGGVPPSLFLLASALLLGTGLLVARWVVRVR